MNGIAPFFCVCCWRGGCFSTSTTLSLSLSPLYFSSPFPPPFSFLFSLSFHFPFSIKRCSLHLSPHHNLARFCGLVFLQAAEAIDVCRRDFVGLRGLCFSCSVVQKYVKHRGGEGLKMLKSERAVLSEKDIFFVNL